MTTINTSNEQILKEDLVKDIYFEGKAVKVYGKIYGLTNLGRTFFVSEAEVNKVNNDAQTQMMQKYGSEVYGGNAQLKNQKSTGTASSSGYTEASDKPLSGGGLISCNVTPLAELPDKFFEASGGDYKALGDSLDKFENYLKEKLKNDEWKNAHAADVNTFFKNKALFRGGVGPDNNSNTTAWKAINDLLDNDTWKKELAADKNLKKIVDDMRNGWKSWAGKEDGGAASTGEVKKKENGDDRWNPKLPFKITIQTNFDENWYKRKFKSGLLNKMIFAVKTAAMDRTSPSVKANDTNRVGHKYTADEMLPEEQRKLDSIRWKMTNKVAKDYVSYLLGWSRKKVATKKADKDGTIVPQEELKRDSGVGSKMAKNALSGRGLLGRLRQKLFAGGQSSNEISVAFQLADWNDGWKIVDEKTGEPVDGGEGKEGKDGKGGEGGKGGKGTGGGSGNGASGNGGSGSGNGGSSGGKGGNVNLDDKQMQSLLSLLQRVERLEDEVGVGEGSKGQKEKKPEQDGNKKEQQANESTDPFSDVFGGDCISNKRRGLVKKVCESGSSLDKLVDDCIFGDID